MSDWLQWMGDWRIGVLCALVALLVVIRLLRRIGKWWRRRRPARLNPKLQAFGEPDERLVEHAVGYARKKGIPADRFEFQMLYGVRRDLHSKLRERGFNMRVYVPFGHNWYPYLMRRLGERPGNLGFMLGSIIRETIARH